MARVSRLLMLVMLLVLVPVRAAMAQATGGMTGVVTDDTGAVVPGVTVEVVNQGDDPDPGRSSPAPTASIAVPLLPPGQYNVKATLAGFKTAVREGVTVRVNDTARVGRHDGGRRGRGGGDRHRRGAAGRDLARHARHRHRRAEGRRPAAERPQLHPARHADSRRRGAAGRARRRRPATPRPAASATPPAGFSVNGMRNQSNNFLLDGASNNDTFNTGFVLRPPPDAIQEFKILTHSYSAEYGRNAGSVVNVVTKSRHQPAARRAPGSSTATTRCRRATSSRRRTSPSRS